MLHCLCLVTRLADRRSFLLVVLSFYGTYQKLSGHGWNTLIKITDFNHAPTRFNGDMRLSTLPKIETRFVNIGECLCQVVTKSEDRRGGISLSLTVVV